LAVKTNYKITVKKTFSSSHNISVRM